MNETSTQRRAETRSRIDRAADGRSTRETPEQAGSVRSGSGKTWGLIGLVVLTSVTSLVVATISIWLVPVYMATMALIFATPKSPRQADAATTPESPPAAPSPNAAPPRAADVEGTPVEGAEAVADAQPAEAVDPAPAKPRKRRAKAKRGKTAQAAEAPASEPTWIRVGPGKFVRADVQAAPAETPTEADPTTLSAADLSIESETTPSADVDSDVEAEAVELLTHEDATPASPREAGPCEVISPVPFNDDEAEPTESDEEYGIAPSALAGAFDEEYGIAPSALAETWTPEALPEAVADDEPTPDDEPTEAEAVAQDEDESDARSQVVETAEFEATADEPEDEAEIPPAPIAAPAMVAQPSPERPAPGGTAAASRGIARTCGLGTVRRASRPRERHDRPRSPRHRGAVAVPTRSGRLDRVRVRGSERGRRRSDPTRRRPHPRSPPRRA